MKKLFPILLIAVMTVIGLTSPASAQGSPTEPFDLTGCHKVTNVMSTPSEDPSVYTIRQGASGQIRVWHKDNQTMVTSYLCGDRNRPKVGATSLTKCRGDEASIVLDIDLDEVGKASPEKATEVHSKNGTVRIMGVVPDEQNEHANLYLCVNDYTRFPNGEVIVPVWLVLLMPLFIGGLALWSWVNNGSSSSDNRSSEPSS